jgi:hypothetical protein
MPIIRKMVHIFIGVFDSPFAKTGLTPLNSTPASSTAESWLPAFVTASYVIISRPTGLLVSEQVTAIDYGKRPHHYHFLNIK